MTSEATARANEFVQARLPRARSLGRELADLVEDPEAFVSALEAGLRTLADPVYARAQPVVAPGVGPVVGVRRPLSDAIVAQLRGPLARRSAAISIYLAERLGRAGRHEVRAFALVALRRSLPDDPERSWQLIRRIARAANDWITIDSLANLVAVGILLEPRRWAELEQLVYSPSRWERRLVGSVIARLPFNVDPDDRRRLAPAAALPAIGSLMGDADPEVQKALARALRSWLEVDPEGVEALLRAETERAVATGDGHRAWVIRDAMSLRPPSYAEELRARLAGLRRRPDQPPTSAASEAVRAFRGLLDVGGERRVERGGSYLREAGAAAHSAGRGAAAPSAPGRGAGVTWRHR